MRVATVLTALSAAGFVAARPGVARRQDDAPEVTDAPAEPTETAEVPAPEEPAPEPSDEEPVPEPTGEEPAPQPTGEEPAPEEPEVPEEPSEPAPEPVPDTPSPFEGRKLYVNPDYAEKLDQTAAAFEEAGDEDNAARVRTIQDIGTFVWITTIDGLEGIDTAIERARADQEETGEDHIVGLVLYNLPDRDCSAGESAGELSSAENGLEIYKEDFIKPYAEKLAAADDLTFAVVLEPDSLANSITNSDIEFCAEATPVYEEGIAHAISELQFDHVHLYIDAAHGGWLGWDDNLEPTAKQFSKVVGLAGEGKKIRGFATNVSNYNPFNTTFTEEWLEGSNSFDEGHYALSLAPHLEAEGLPTRFIIDQGRVTVEPRPEAGLWCNISPAGFGGAPGSPTGNNTLIDSLVWIKPGGESDGECGMEGAPIAGAWFDEYVQMLVENADPSLFGEPSEPAEPSEPVEEPAEPSEPVEEPAEPSGPVEEPAEPSEPVEEPAEPSEPVEEPAEPAETAE